MQLPHALAGMVPQVASPIRLSETPVEYRNAPPLLGEHTRQVDPCFTGVTNAAGVTQVDFQQVRLTLGIEMGQFSGGGLLVCCGHGVNKVKMMGAAQRWQIGRADGAPFAVAGIWREWPGDDGPVYSFTQLTINADDHPLMRRFHKPGDEKRSLIVIAADEYDDWLRCRDPERARSYFQSFPPELMRAWFDPPPPRQKKLPLPEDSRQIDLF